MSLEELLSQCTFERVSPSMLEQCEPFSCGHEDLDDFFRSDYKLYADKLLGKTYAFRCIDNPSKIVSIFTLSNDAIRIKQLLPIDKEQIEYVTENGEKNLRRFPGVLIGRLGTNQTVAGKGYGTAVMDFIKAWFRSDENKTGCRPHIGVAGGLELYVAYHDIGESVTVVGDCHYLVCIALLLRAECCGERICVSVYGRRVHVV